MGRVFQIAELHAVRLYIRLIADIEAVQIAKLVKTRIVRVVSGTHGVDIVLLPQLEIFLDAIHSNTERLIREDWEAIISSSLLQKSS